MTAQQNTTAVKPSAEALEISHVINAAFNNVPWFSTPIQELEWMIHDRLTALNLSPPRYIIFCKRSSIRTFRINFHRHGFAIKPEQVEAMLITTDRIRAIDRRIHREDLLKRSLTQTNRKTNHDHRTNTGSTDRSPYRNC